MTYRIVVGTDFSEVSEHAVAQALQLLAGTRSGVLHLAHVVIEHEARHGENIARDDRLMDDALARLKATLLPKTVAKGSSGDHAEFEVVYHTRLAKDVASGLEQLALDVGASLVAVGTHGRKGLERWVLGSVARVLLENGRVPLLVARPFSFEGMKRSDAVEPPKPGVNVHAKRYDLVASSERLSFDIGNTRIAGMGGL